MNSKWELFKLWLKTPKGKRIVIFSIIALVVLSVAGYVVYNRYFKKNIQESKNANLTIDVKKEKVEEKVVSNLNGLKYTKDVANRHPIAVMVENHPDARPQAGLDKAAIIYEAEAEGGITRFMAIYGPEDASMVGPVRSARTYYLDWALEYDAFYAHCGGNMDALELIPQIGIKDINQFQYGEEAFWREDLNVDTEHTMFTDISKLRDIAKNNGWTTSTSDFTPFKFKTDADESTRPATQKIYVNFSSDLWNVVWEYDPATNTYIRYMAGEPHKDRVNGNQLAAKNIIVQEVTRSLTTTSINEVGWAMNTVGSGTAVVFMDGKRIDATWKKDTRNDRTIFYDPSGAEIEFNPGQTWYQIVPSMGDLAVE